MFLIFRSIYFPETCSYHSFLSSFSPFCRSPSLPFPYIFRDLGLFLFSLSSTFSSSSHIMLHRVLFLSPNPHTQDSGPGKAFWSFGAGTKGAPLKALPTLPKKLLLKENSLQLPSNPAIAGIIIASHLMVKNWPETKEIELRVGFRDSVGLSPRTCDFGGRISMLDPLSNLAHPLFVFLSSSFLIFFFFEVKFRHFFQEGRHCWVA